MFTLLLGSQNPEPFATYMHILETFFIMDIASSYYGFLTFLTYLSFRRFSPVTWSTSSNHGLATFTQISPMKKLLPLAAKHR